MRTPLAPFIVCVTFMCIPGRARVDDRWGPCPYPGKVIVPTDAYSIELGSASGARGDVVGVTVSLTSELPSGLQRAEDGGMGFLCVFSHDPSIAEIVGTPVYGDEFMEIASSSTLMFHAVDEDLGIPRHVQGMEPVGHGFFLSAGLKWRDYNARFPSPEPLPIMTVFYRLKGSPGTTGSFSNSEPGSIQFGNIRCSFTQIFVYRTPGGETDYVSSHHRLGTLTVVDGPATHPDPPPSTEAKVYPRAPESTEANLRITLDTVDSWPGARDVPISVSVSADVEYRALFLGFDYDPSRLRFSRGEHRLTGSVIGNQYPGKRPEAFVYLLVGSTGNRRIAAEGELVRAGTLYFDVLDSGNDGDQAIIKLTGSPEPFIGVLHEGESGPPIRPTAVADGVINIWEAPFTRRGDANLDGKFDISDPVGLLAHLFLGGVSPACRGAADYDLSGQFEITDPVTMIGVLFLGDEPPGGTSHRDVSCRSL